MYCLSFQTFLHLFPLVRNMYFGSTLKVCILSSTLTNTRFTGARSGWGKGVMPSLSQDSKKGERRPTPPRTKKSHYLWVCHDSTSCIKFHSFLCSFSVHKRPISRLLFNSKKWNSNKFYAEISCLLSSLYTISTQSRGEGWLESRSL